MAMYLNQATIQSWIDLEAPVDAVLVRIFEEAKVDPTLIDVWTDSMVENSSEEEGATCGLRVDIASAPSAEITALIIE
jgi:hypothetical protein